MIKKPAEEHVTQTSFDKEVKGLHQKINSAENRLDKNITALNNKFDNVALAVVDTNHRLDRIESTLETSVATKTDMNRMMNTLDHILKKVTAFDQEERVQSLHLEDARRTINDHEKRITNLESSR